nr:hypothetical protein CFP56_21326 [Quercus suber]
MSMYESMQRRYGYRELNVAKWNDPRGSVHPARGGPRASVVAADSAGKVYQPTYKVSYRRPLPQATDDEESEDEVRSTEVASGSGGVDADVDAGSISMDLPNESQEPTVTVPAPGNSETGSIDDETVIKKDVEDGIPAPDNDDSIPSTSEPEPESSTFLPNESPGAPNLVEHINSSAEKTQDELSAWNEDESVSGVAEVVPVVTEPEANTEPSRPPPEGFTEVSVAMEDSEQDPADKVEDHQETGAILPAQAGVSEEFEQVGGIVSSTDATDEATENGIPPPVPDPPHLKAQETDPTDIPVFQENEAALDVTPVVLEGDIIETKPSTPQPIEVVNEHVSTLSPEPSVQASNDELIIDTDAQNIPVSVEPCANIDEPAIVVQHERTTAVPTDQVQTMTDIAEDRNSPVDTTEELTASTPEAQIEESEDKKVSWAPDTPEPKPTVRKKKSSKASKSKVKKKLMIREDRDRDHVTKTLDFVDGSDVPASPPTPPGTDGGLDSSDVGIREEFVSTAAPTRDEQNAGDKPQLSEDVTRTAISNQASPNPEIDTLDPTTSVLCLSSPPLIVEDSARISITNTDIPEKESKKKDSKSNKDKEKSKRKSSLKSKGEERVPLVETDAAQPNDVVLDKHTGSVLEDVPSSAVPTEVEQPKSKDPHVDTPPLAHLGARNEAVPSSTTEAGPKEGTSMLVSDGPALAEDHSALDGDSALEISSSPQEEALTTKIAPGASLVIETDNGDVDTKSEGNGIPPDDERIAPTQTGEPVTVSQEDSQAVSLGGDSKDVNAPLIKVKIEETGDEIKGVHEQEESISQGPDAAAVMSGLGNCDLSTAEDTKIEVEADPVAKLEALQNERPAQEVTPGAEGKTGGEAKASNDVDAAKEIETTANVESAADIESPIDVEAVVEGETVSEAGATMESVVIVGGESAVKNETTAEGEVAVEILAAVESEAVADVVPATVVVPVEIESPKEAEFITDTGLATGIELAADAEHTAETGSPAEIRSAKDVEPAPAENIAEVPSDGGSAVASTLETDNALGAVDTLDGTTPGTSSTTEETLAETTKSADDVDRTETKSNATGTDKAVVILTQVQLETETSVENLCTDAKHDARSETGHAEETILEVQDPLTKDADVGESGKENQTAESATQSENGGMAPDTLASKQNSEDCPGENIMEKAIVIQDSSNIFAGDNDNTHNASETSHHIETMVKAYTDGQQLTQGKMESKDTEETSVQTQSAQPEPAPPPASNVDILEAKEPQAVTLDPGIGTEDGKARGDGSTTSGDPQSIAEQSEVIVEEVADPASDSGSQDVGTAQKLPKTSDSIIEDAGLVKTEAVNPVTHMAEDEGTTSAIGSEGVKDASAPPLDTLSTMPPTLISDLAPSSNPAPVLAEMKQDDTSSSDDVVAAIDEDTLSKVNVKEPEVGPSVAPTAAGPESADVSKQPKTDDPALAPMSTSTETGVKTNAEPEVVQGEDTTKSDPSIDMLPVNVSRSLPSDSIAPEKPADTSLGSPVEEVQSPDERSGTLPTQEDVVERSDLNEQRVALETTQTSPHGEKLFSTVHDLAQVKGDVDDKSPDMVAEPVIAAAVSTPTTTNVAEAAAAQAIGESPGEATSTAAEALPVVGQIPEPQPVIVVPPAPPQTTGRQRSSKHRSKHGERSIKSAVQDGKTSRSVDLPKLARKPASRNLVQESHTTHIRKPSRVSMTASELEEQAERRRRRAARKAAETARILEEEQKLAYESEQRLAREAEERRVRREARRSEKNAIAKEDNRRAREDTESAALKEAEYRRQRRRDSVREQDVRPSTRDAKSGLFSLPRSFTGESANKVPSFTRTGIGGPRSSGSRDHRARPTSSSHSAEGQPESKVTPPRDNSPTKDQVPLESSAKDTTGDTKYKPHHRHRHRSNKERPRSDGKERDGASSSPKNSNEPTSSRKDGDRRPPTTPLRKEERKKKPGLFGRLFG